MATTSSADSSALLPVPDAAATRRGRDIALVLAAGFLVRLYLIYRYPIVFGGDTVARLAHPDRIVLSHNLPLLQIAIHYAHMIANGPLPIRYFLAAVGAAAGAGCYLLVSDLVPAAAALDGSLLFVASPFILADSIVPYEETLMLAGLLFAFHFAFTERWALASLCLGMACLTRYEAWIACPVVAGVYLRRSRDGLTPRALLTAVLLVGWAPLGWFIYNRGISPPGSYALGWSTNPERLLRWAHLGVVTLRYSAWPTLLLAAWGGVLFFRLRRFEEPAYQWLLAFGGLFLVTLLFSAHGMGDHPARVLTEREAHIPLVGVTLLAALGLAGLPFRHAITALSVAVGLWMADRYVHRATSDPHFALSYRVAQFLDRDVPANERVVVLARGINAEPALARMERERGPEAVRKTLPVLRALDMAMPPDYQRILVHSHSTWDRLSSYATLSLGRFADSTTALAVPALPAARPHWAVLWSDFAPTNAVEAELAAQLQGRQPRDVFQQDNVWVRLYALTP